MIAVEGALPYDPPLAVGPLARFLAAHAVPGLERSGPLGRHVRTVPAPSGPALVAVDLTATPGAVAVRVEVENGRDVAGVTARVRRWLGLDADPRPAEAALGSEPLLGPLVAARPGLRVPGAVDGTETALLAVLGQQVSLAAARTFAGRLVAAYGDRGPDGLHAFPAAEVLAAAGPEALRAATGVTGARARTLHAVAAAVADGLHLAPDADAASARAALTALPGVGPWTAEYVGLRVLGDPDAFLAGDLVLRRALGAASAREAEARAEAWRPYRATALLHLWTAAVFAG